MRRSSAALAALLVAGSLNGQNYRISTFAGGGLPVNLPGAAAHLGAVSDVVLDTAGNLVLSITDYNVVMRQDAKTGILTLIAGNGTAGYSGDNGSAIDAQLNGPTGVAVDSDGNVYIADTGNGSVRKVSNGVISTIAGNGAPGYSGDGASATSAQLNSCFGLALDPAGNLYIADGGNGRIRKVSKGVITTVAGGGLLLGDGGPATSARLVGPYGIAIDSSGNLYIADANDSRVRKVSNGTITTVAGTGTMGNFFGNNGPATGANLAQPFAVAVGPNGDLYIADGANRLILRVSHEIITIVAGGGTNGLGDNGPATSAALLYPQGLAFDAGGALYIADPGLERIRKVMNAVIATVAGGGPLLGDDGPPASAGLYNPTGIAWDPAGNTYIADFGNRRIARVANGLLTTFAGGGSTLGDHGPATDAGVIPSAVAVDLKGNVYVSDFSRVRKISGGIITTVAGNDFFGFSGDNGPATSARLNAPAGLALDASGNLYIADTQNNRVREVSNGIITTVAGGGTPGSVNRDGGPATKANLYGPVAVAVDASGNLYIAERDGNRVRKVVNGIITTVAGNGLPGFSGDGGPATDARLSASGIALDGAGNLLIADVANSRIRRVSNGVITTIAGGGSAFGDGGPATGAQLDLPWAVALDPDGKIYVVDGGNQRVRVLTPDSSSCTYSATPDSLQVPASGGDLDFTIQTGASCAWSITGLPAWVTVSGAASGVGNAALSVVVGANAGVLRSGQFTISGVSLAVNVVVNQGSTVPSVNPAGIVNAADYEAPVAAGSIVTVFGNFPLTSPDSSVSLQFGGIWSVPAFFASSTQVSAQVPWELAGQTQTTITATVDGQTSAARTFAIAPFAPGIFSINGQGTGQGAILDSDYKLVDASNPATAGTTVVQIYCTGLGPVDNQPPTDVASPAGPFATTQQPVSVLIGGADAPVLFSGLAPGFVGLYQVNAQVPAASSKGNAVPVFLIVGDPHLLNENSNTVTIAVH